MGVATDCKYTSTYGSAQNATRAILNDWNSATARYKSTFNVSLGIVQLEVHDEICPTTVDPTTPWNTDCFTNTTLNDRLSLFSQWRGERANDGIGLWHLMSGCPTGTEVGVAWLGTLCQSDATGSGSQIVSGTAVTTAGPTEWEIVAHEVGHNFGAIHDCSAGCTLTGPCCPFTTTTCSTTSLFIMNPTSAPSETTFSPCSVGNICTSLRSTLNTSCLQDAFSPSKPLITLQMCGNGIVEPGEQCDPGQGEQSSCCDTKTCQFLSGAVCDPASSPCCAPTCQFAPSGQICRPAQDPVCDVAESCTGASSQCPADVTKPNGMACGANGLTCASGICTSVSQQCQTVGASLNLTTACSQQASTGCQLSCQDPSSADQCIVLQATLPNGLPCGYGGTCESGTCQAGDLISTAKAWYLQNLQISIPITVVAGVIALFALFGIIRASWRCCRRRDSRELIARTNRPTSQETLLPAGRYLETRYADVAPPVKTRIPPFRGVEPEDVAYLRSHSRQPSSSAEVPGNTRMGSSQPRRHQLRRPPRSDWVDAALYNGQQFANYS